MMWSKKDKQEVPEELPENKPHPNFNPEEYLKHMKTLHHQLGMDHHPVTFAHAPKTYHDTALQHPPNHQQNPTPQKTQATPQPQATPRPTTAPSSLSQDTLQELRSKLGISLPDESLRHLHSQLYEQANTDAEDMAKQYEQEQAAIQGDFFEEEHEDASLSLPPTKPQVSQTPQEKKLLPVKDEPVSDFAKDIEEIDDFIPPPERPPLAADELEQQLEAVVEEPLQVAIQEQEGELLQEKSLADSTTVETQQAQEETKEVFPDMDLSLQQEPATKFAQEDTSTSLPQTSVAFAPEDIHQSKEETAVVPAEEEESETSSDSFDETMDPLDWGFDKEEPEEPSPQPVETPASPEPEPSPEIATSPKQPEEPQERDIHQAIEDHLQHLTKELRRIDNGLETELQKIQHLQMGTARLRELLETADPLRLKIYYNKLSELYQTLDQDDPERRKWFGVLKKLYEEIAKR